MRSRLLVAASISSLSLVACVGLLGDFTVGGGAAASSGGDADGSANEASSNNDDGSSSSGGSDGNASDGNANLDAPGDGPLSTDTGEPNLIAANGQATCAGVTFHAGKPDEKHATFCWGANGDATQLGRVQTDPTFNGFTRPRLAGGAANAYVVFDQLSGSAGGYWFIGRSAENLGSGASQVPYSWGNNDQAECGKGKTVLSLIPTEHAPDTGAIRVLTATAAPHHGCMINGTNQLYCWGQNNACEVRSGATADCNKTVADPFVRFVEDETDTIGGGKPPAYEFDRFAGGDDHSCVVYRKTGATTAAVECWGNNLQNQTGLTGKTFVESPSEVANTASAAGFGSIELAAGSAHTCAILGKQDLVCWGKNDFGQAIPLSDMPATPKKVVTPINMQGQLTGLALGNDVSCFIQSLKSASPHAVCYGNKTGPLGRSAAEATADFGFVDGIKDVTALAVGGTHACAIARAESDPVTAPRAVFCWGSNTEKQVDPNLTATTSATAHRVNLPVPQ